MKAVWNHWFWITIGLWSQVLGESLIFEEKPKIDAEAAVSLSAGARGGKILSGAVFPPELARPRPLVLTADKFRFPFPAAAVGPAATVPGPSVSVSKSVSKVSVKMGSISVGGPNQVDPLGPVGPGLVPHFYVNPAVGSNRVDETRAQARRIDPQYISYNLVYREPEKFITTTTPKPMGLLQSIIAKLKSLARATSAGIRFSNLLSPVSPIIKPASPVKPSSAPGVLVRVDDLGVVGEPGAAEKGALKEEEQQVEEEEEEEEPILLDTEPFIQDDLAELEAVEAGPEVDNHIEEDRPRSAEARGRSLPLHVLEEIELKSEEVRRRGGEIKIKEINSQEWEGEELEEAVARQAKVEEEVDQWIRKEKEVHEEDFNHFSGNGLDPVSESYRIEMERVGTANISAIVGVIVGIIIFIIISVVLIMLAIQRGRRIKKAGPAEDVISQSSYMTYSTTVSDQSVQYGPGWEKDIVDDLCSLDNDSFLNSLEAVTTTDYWADSKY